ncbi:hypothetical protein BRYFOR_06899 [Marvinbryantia formatexigens DSM 14469]|uniref:Uncharacterized protein n=1 Tax=Marvinbryantia formatexigens DSM 14469 TaxID=478749 RepID=C6LE50_9FIRM|nr:hypothetical protein BRYFOR_06899 [Marvinbryantia formatexigens DSM 14469]
MVMIFTVTFHGGSNRIFSLSLEAYNCFSSSCDYLEFFVKFFYIA